MPVLHITEFTSFPTHGIIHLPPFRTTTLLIYDYSVISEKLGPNTLSVRLHCDTPCCFKHTNKPDDQATIEDIPIGAGQTEYFAVHPSHFIAVISNR